MIASTSHDMRTPLNTIINMLLLISSRVNDVREVQADEQLKKWVRVASNSTQLLQYLVSDTLDYFQIRSGKFRAEEESLSLREIVDHAFDLISIQMHQKRLRRLVDIEDDVLDDVQFDKQRLSQILVNLLSNAVKFTFEGFIKVKI